MNWWREEIVEDGDESPVGIVRCTDKDETRVCLATAGLGHPLFGSRYQVAPPSADELCGLVAASREQLGQRAVQAEAS